MVALDGFFPVMGLLSSGLLSVLCPCHMDETVDNSDLPVLLGGVGCRVTVLVDGVGGRTMVLVSGVGGRAMVLVGGVGGRW